MRVDRLDIREAGPARRRCVRCVCCVSALGLRGVRPASWMSSSHAAAESPARAAVVLVGDGGTPCRGGREGHELARLLPGRRRQTRWFEDARSAAARASYAIVMVGALVMCACLVVGLGARPSLPARRVEGGSRVLHTDMQVSRVNARCLCV